MMEKIRLLLADDHFKVRRQMITRLSREADLEIIGQAANSMQTIKIALLNKPQVILIDPAMRDGKGVEAIHRITKNLPGTAVVVLTAFVDTIMAIELRRAGVRQILSKGIPSQQLLQVLREAVRPGPSPQTIQ